MSRYNLYTTAIGIISVLLLLTIYNSDFDLNVKILLAFTGVSIFLHSAWSLYSSGGQVSNYRNSKKIRRIFLLDKRGEPVQSWELYGKVSMLIGKDIGENSVDIDLSKSPYAAMVDVEHAILNYAEGNWFVEDIESRNGISIKKFGVQKIYKLSKQEPCKLDFGDVIFIGNCQLRVAD